MALFVLSLCPFNISVGVGAFVIGLSQISSFFSSQTLQFVLKQFVVMTTFLNVKYYLLSDVLQELYILH